MRALSGAIITAGALIGLGLTAVAFGIRFHGYPMDAVNSETHQLYGIPSLTVTLVVLLSAVVIGLGIAFLGLAYHHERRYHELVSRIAERRPAGKLADIAERT